LSGEVAYFSMASRWILPSFLRRRPGDTGGRTCSIRGDLELPMIAVRWDTERVFSQSTGFRREFDREQTPGSPKRSSNRWKKTFTGQHRESLMAMSGRALSYNSMECTGFCRSRVLAGTRIAGELGMGSRPHRPRSTAETRRTGYGQEEF